MDSNSSIFKSAAKFFSGTLISRVTGYLRDLSMAFSFGTSAPLAAFFTAFRLSNLPRRLLGEGGMQTAFIPHYEELKHSDSKNSLQFFVDLSAWLSLILLSLVILTIAGLIGLKYLFTSPGALEIIELTAYMMPGLFFICLYGLNAGLLECERSFFTPSIAPVAFNFVWIGFALALMHHPIDQAMVILSIGISLGCMGQWLVTLPQVYRLLKGKNIRINLASPEVKRLWRPLFLTNLGIISTQINSGLDPLFARYANLEGPAWLWYAIRIEQVPLALFGIALSGALLPPLARSVREGNLSKFYSFLFTALKRSAYLMIPITIAIFLFGGWGVNLAFGYGDFGMKSLEGTVACLWGYSIGLLPQTWVLILAPAFFARGDYKTPAIASVSAVVANTFFNAVAIFGFGWGAESVAYATSLAAVVNCAILWIRLRQTLPQVLQESKT